MLKFNKEDGNPIYIPESNIVYVEVLEKCMIVTLKTPQFQTVYVLRDYDAFRAISSPVKSNVAYVGGGMYD